MEKDQFKCPGKQFTIINIPYYNFYVSKFLLKIFSLEKNSIQKF